MFDLMFTPASMGSSIRKFQERVRELEKINRMQAIEIWQLKDEKWQLEKKMEALLVPLTDGKRPALRKISFGPVFFSDGSKQTEVGGEIEMEDSVKEVEAGDNAEDVEEVDEVTYQYLANTGEGLDYHIFCSILNWNTVVDSDGGWWNNGQLCIGSGDELENLYSPLGDPEKDSVSKEAAPRDAEGEVLKNDVELEEDFKVGGDPHCHGKCGSGDDTLLSGVQKIVHFSDANVKDFLRDPLAEGLGDSHSREGMELTEREKNSKMRTNGGSNKKKEESGYQEQNQKPKLRPRLRRRTDTEGRGKILFSDKEEDAQGQAGKKVKEEGDLGLNSGKGKAGARGIRGKLDITYKGLKEETCAQELFEPKPKRRRVKVDQEGNNTGNPEENGNVGRDGKADDSGNVQLESKGECEIGDLVTVSWGGIKYNCKVVAVEALRVKVHYLRFSSCYDEWVSLPGKSAKRGEKYVGTKKEERGEKASMFEKEGDVLKKRDALPRENVMEEIAELLTRSALDLEPLLPPTKVNHFV